MSNCIKSKIVFSEKSRQEFSCTDIEQIITEIKQYKYALIWRLDRVELILTANLTDVNDMTEVRAFSEEKELHLVLYKGKFIGRIRRDSVGKKTECYDEYCLVWGKPKSYDGKYTCLYEDRGIKINVPIEVPENERAFLQIRSYLKDDVFEFDDFRIAGIIAKEAELNE